MMHSHFLCLAGYEQFIMLKYRISIERMDLQIAGQVFDCMVWSVRSSAALIRTWLRRTTVNQGTVWQVDYFVATWNKTLQPFTKWAHLNNAIKVLLIASTVMSRLLRVSLVRRLRFFSVGVGSFMICVYSDLSLLICEEPLSDLYVIFLYTMPI